MPLIAGSNKTVGNTPTSLLYALGDALMKSTGASHIYTEEVMIGGYYPDERISVNLGEALYNNEHRILLYGYKDGNGQSAPYVLSTDMGNTSSGLVIAVDPEYLGYGERYGGYAKCLLAYDDRMDSVMIALYGGETPASTSDEDLYSDYGPVIIWLAKTESGSLCIGNGSSIYTDSDEYKCNLRKTGIIFSDGSWSNTVPSVYWPNISVNWSYANDNNLLYLAKMPNLFYKDNNDSQFTKTMMMTVTVPKIPENPKKFGIRYQIEDQRFISFINLGSQSYRIQLLDAWCPY